MIICGFPTFFPRLLFPSPFVVSYINNKRAPVETFLRIFRDPSSLLRWLLALFSLIIAKYKSSYAPVKLFCPHPPRGHHFFCVTPVLL